MVSLVAPLSNECPDRDNGSPLIHGRYGGGDEGQTRREEMKMDGRSLPFVSSAEHFLCFVDKPLKFKP